MSNVNEYIEKQQHEILGQGCVDFICSFGNSLVKEIGTTVDPYQGVFKLNDGSGFITAQDYETAWYPYPYWFKCMYELVDNGEFSKESLYNLTVGEVCELRADRDFKLQVSYCKADSQGHVHF